MNFLPLKTQEDVDAAVRTSFEHPVLIFKHSSRCSISRTALDRFQRAADRAGKSLPSVYFVDVVDDRPVSMYIMEVTGVTHQSPQLLALSGGKSLYDGSHMSIYLDEAMASIQK